MARLEQALAFPLYASVAWLVWVVSQQAGSPGVAAALAGLVLIAFAAWLYQVSRGRSRAPGGTWRRPSVAALGVGAVGAPALDSPAAGRAAARPAAPSAGWEPFSAQRLAELRAAGKPVFVNVTAAWCLTCLVNERVGAPVERRHRCLRPQGRGALKADWTTPRSCHHRACSARSDATACRSTCSIPPGPAGEPTVLPQILTEGVVVDATEKI